MEAGLLLMRQARSSHLSAATGVKTHANSLRRMFPERKLGLLRDGAPRPANRTEYSLILNGRLICSPDVPG